MQASTRATLMALTGYSIWGFSFLFSKLAMGSASPLVMLAVRFAVSFLTLNLLALSGKVNFHLRGKPLGPLLLLGFVQPVLYFICETYGIALTSSSFAGVMIGLVPVVGLVFGRLFLKENCTLRQVACAVASIVGVMMTTVGGLGNISLPGTLILMGAVLCAALFNTISRSISQQFSAFERTYVMFALGSVVYVIIAVAENRRDLSVFAAALSSPGFLAAVFYLAVLSSVCGFLLINSAVSVLSVGKICIFNNFVTVISVLAGIFIMKDSFTGIQLLGIVVIILSVLGVSYQKGEPAPAEKE